MKTSKPESAQTREPYPFFTTLRVRFNETDAQGHVNFAWYLNYFDVALMEYMHSVGYSYEQMRADGFDLLYIDAHARYHSPCYFDEWLRVHCQLGHLGNTSMRFDFQIFAEAEQRLVCTGEIAIVVADRESQKKTRVPDRFRHAIGTTKVS